MCISSQTRWPTRSRIARLYKQEDQRRTSKTTPCDQQALGIVHFAKMAFGFLFGCWAGLRMDQNSNMQVDTHISSHK